MATMTNRKNEDYCELLSNELSSIKTRLDTIRVDLKANLGSTSIPIDGRERRLTQLTNDMVQVTDSIDVTLDMLAKECVDTSWVYRAGPD